MSGLRSILADLRATIEAVPKRHVLPPPARRATSIAVGKITRGLDVALKQPGPNRLEAAWRTVSTHCGEGRDPSDLPLGTLRDIVWLLWDRHRPASALPGVLQAVQSLALSNPLTLRRYIEVWIRDYDSNLANLRASGRWIAKALAENRHPRHALWRKAHQAYSVFDPVQGPVRVAGALLGPDGHKVLADLGFDTPLRAASGYMRTVVSQFGTDLPRHMRGSDPKRALERAKQVYIPFGTPRFEEQQMRCGMADALVGAWVGGQGPDAVRDEVLDLMRTHVGDPRTQPARWADASEETRRIVRGWLARVTMSAFFDVIGRHAGAAGLAHHWEARKKFWSACLRKGWVSDSWLVLGDNVRRNVELDRELRGNFGRLQQSRVTNHSALLIQIGKTVFVEWSHNGKLYAWPETNGSGRLFARTGTYTISELTAECLSFPPPANRPDLMPSGTNGLTHHPSVWQGRVAALIRQREGRLIQPHEWT